MQWNSSQTKFHHKECEWETYIDIIYEVIMKLWLWCKIHKYVDIFNEYLNISELCLIKAHYYTGAGNELCKMIILQCGIFIVCFVYLHVA